LSFQAEDGIRDRNVTGVQTCALPIYRKMYLGVLPPNRPSSRPFSSAAAALGSAAEAAAAFAATRPATEAAAPAFRKLRRENLKFFITKIPFSLQRMPNGVRGLAATPQPALRAVHACSFGTVLLYSSARRGETISAQSFGKK